MIEWKVIQLYVQMFLDPFFYPFSVFFQPFYGYVAAKMKNGTTFYMFFGSRNLTH